MSETIVNVDHWSYSSAKDIYRKGVDYAVALKLGLISKKYGKSADIGSLIHAYLFGGRQEFTVSPYTDFRTKEAREWRDSQTLPIISDEEFETITKVGDAVKTHPLASTLLFNDKMSHEVKVSANIDGRPWVGFADAVMSDGDKVIHLADLKTTAQFDDFKFTAKRNDYDLQATLYNHMAGAQDAPFYWFIAETVPPYRVGVAVASPEFLESGYKKLQFICDALDEFDGREGKNDLDRLSFNLNKTMDDLMVLGDWSL